MTEKRFTIDDGYGQTVYWHIKEGGVVIGKKCGQKHIAYVVERLNQLYDENEQLKQYIYDNLDEDICDVCSYQYLEKSQMDKYYVAKCKKGYDNCSKGTVTHCKDFKFKELI